MDWVESPWTEKPIVVESERPGGVWRWRPRWPDLLVVAGIVLLLASQVFDPTVPTARPEVVSTEEAVHAVNRALGAMESPHRLVLLFDLSGSMQEFVPNTSPPISKWELVKLGVAEFLEELEEDTEVGLYVFGQSSFRCAPPERLRGIGPLGPDGAQEIVRSLGKLTPTGDTPLARALSPAAEELGSDGGQLILLSDGVDSCVNLNEVCAEARAVATRGVPLRIDLVSMFMSEDARQALACVPGVADGKALDFLGGTPTALAGLLWRVVPLRLGIALALVLLGWFTFFWLGDLLAESLGGMGMVWGRAGFIADIAFASLAVGWAALWFSRVARLPVALVVVLAIAAVLFVCRTIVRQRAAGVGVGESFHFDPVQPSRNPVR